MSSGKRRSQEERRALAAQAWERKQRGWSHVRVAQDLGICVKTVSTLLKQFYGCISKTGFGGAMDPALRTAIARLGSRAAQERGTAHRWTSEEARAAGLKGTTTTQRRGRSPTWRALTSLAIASACDAVAKPTGSTKALPSGEFRTGDTGAALLTDEQWTIAEALLPPLPRRADGRGRPWHDSRAVLNGILWILRTGSPWEDMPARFPSQLTCRLRFHKWVEDGSLERVLRALACANTPPLSGRRLTDDERARLTASFCSSDPVVTRRCHIVSAFACGEPVPQIERSVGCCEKTVRRVLRRFRSEGVAVLTPRPRSSRPHRTQPRAFDRARAERLRALLHRSPREFGKSGAVWTLEWAAEVSFAEGVSPTRVSVETIRQTLIRMGVGWKQAKRWATRPDPT